MKQFPAGKIEPDETAGEAAVRETREETGLLVAPIRALGQQTHPMTGREVHDIVCWALGGEALVASVEELAELAGARHGEIAQYVPYGLFGPVQQHLDTAFQRRPPHVYGIQKRNLAVGVTRTRVTGK